MLRLGESYDDYAAWKVLLARGNVHEGRGRGQESYA
jgi:hypothetical protein